MAPTITLIDFAETSLAKNYATFYAKIIDNVFTAWECADLIALASQDEWLPAGLSAESEQQTVHSSFRNSERVLRIDSEASQKIYERLRPHVEELHEISPGSKWAGIIGKPGKKQGPTMKLTG